MTQSILAHISYFQEWLFPLNIPLNVASKLYQCMRKHTLPVGSTCKDCGNRRAPLLGHDVIPRDMPLPGRKWRGQYSMLAKYHHSQHLISTVVDAPPHEEDKRLQMQLILIQIKKIDALLNDCKCSVEGEQKIHTHSSQYQQLESYTV